MFTRFTSMLHHAVEALAPNVPLQQEFLSHWKAITQYFVDVKDHKMSVDQTPIPGHLKLMLQMLVREEANGDVGVAGPCMEYMLKERILETLYTLARTDCPPGMKQLVLQLFIKLLSHIKQPLLPHIHVHRPVQRLVKMCGEVKASPAETDEIQFLLTLCSVVKQDPYLVNFFIEMPKSKSSDISKSDSPSMVTIEIRRRQNRFIIVDSLLNLMHSEDARVSVKACEGLMLVASLPEENSVKHLLYNTEFTSKLTSQLCSLYASLPKGIYPADVESVDAKWGLDIASSMDDRHSFPGKRSVISFLSWLDFCDQLIAVSHQQVALTLASCIRDRFLNAILEPAIMQTSEGHAVMATAHLNRCLRLIASPELLSEFVFFIIGDETEPESEGVTSNHRLRQRLLERCDHIAEEVCVATWKLFETLLAKPHEHIVNNLVLRNLVSRGYATTVSLPGSIISSPVHEQLDLGHLSLPSSPVLPSEIHMSPKALPLLVNNAGSIDASEIALSCVESSNAILATSGVDLTNCERRSSMATEVKAETSSSYDHGAGATSSSVGLKENFSYSSIELKENLSSAVGLKENLSSSVGLKENLSSSVELKENLSSSSVELKENLSSSVELKENLSSSVELKENLSSSVELKENFSSSVHVPPVSPGFDIPGSDIVDAEKKTVAEESWKRLSVAVTGEGDGPLSLATAALEPREQNCDIQKNSSLAAKREQSEINDGLSFNARFDCGYELNDIRHVVNTFLNFLPKDAISSHHSADSGYDSYLRDAKHQFSSMSLWYRKLNWPSQPVGQLASQDQPFFEGQFLRKLFDKLSSMLHQSYEVNLQVTCVASRLALLPHPNIHEFLLNPHLPLRPGCHSLPVVLQKVANDVQARMRVIPDIQKQLLGVRHRLMGYSNNTIRHSDDVSLLAGVIVFEEFCKELAAIAFVKHHAEALQH